MQRNFTIFASAARTDTHSSQLYHNVDINTNVRGMLLTLDVTAATATPSVVMTVEWYDAASDSYETILTAVAVTGIGKDSYLIYPESAAASGAITQVVNFPMPSVWRVTMTHADTDSITYSLGAMMLP